MKMPENLPSSVYVIAWHKLYKIFGERLEDENLNLMDSILRSTIFEFENQHQLQKALPENQAHD